VNDRDADVRVAHAARVPISGRFFTQRDESVLITADRETDGARVAAALPLLAGIRPISVGSWRAGAGFEAATLRLCAGTSRRLSTD
jgi:hypothetical protein